jgi:hypothetical protein
MDEHPFDKVPVLIYLVFLEAHQRGICLAPVERLPPHVRWALCDDDCVDLRGSSRGVIVADSDVDVREAALLPLGHVDDVPAALTEARGQGWRVS